MQNQLLKKKWQWTASITFLFLPLIVQAQTPVVKVDFNIPSRSESEVNETDYTAWPVGVKSKTIEDVTFLLTNGSYSSGWYKAGVQSPYYARLVNDGMKTSDLELQITGLPAGKHSFVSFHNAFDSPEAISFGPIDIYMNGTLVYDNLELTQRALSNDTATTAYFEFEVTDNDTVTFRFVADPPSDTLSENITICGFHLNSSDPKKMIKEAYPENDDEQVDIDNDTLTFCWSEPRDAAISYNVYMGTDIDNVLNATTHSSQYQGNTTDTFLIKTGFYSMNEYYWRVDPIDSGNDTTKGDVFYFKKRIPSFPGAEGYGGYAIGGRGGYVVYVTNLNDSGPGSLRDAVKNYSGPRTILFKVSGIITLRSRLTLSDDYVTIAGQSAPGKGICIRWAPFGVTGDNDVMQNMRVRLGIGVTYDGMGLTGANNSIIDHCSISWTIDEAFSSRSGENLTLQRTLISEALNAAGHSNYSYGTKHGYAASIGGDVGSFHHNLLAHCEGRNWSMAGGLDGNGDYAGRLDLFNNVVYNWGGRATDGGAHEVNFVNNYYKKGAATSQNTILKAQLEGTGGGSQSYYAAGNILENTDGSFDCDGTIDDCSHTYVTSNGQIVDWDVFVDDPFFESEATINTASDAYKLVLSDVGCTQPVFDDHDIRIIDETLSGTYSCEGSYTSKAGLPDNESDVGYWEIYLGYLRDDNWDTDLDGLPNWWEKVNDLDTNSTSEDYTEANADKDLNGYTNLEEYLQWMGQPHYFLDSTDSIDIDLSQYTRGFTNSPEYILSDITNGSADFADSSYIVRFKPLSEGLSGFTFTVTDAEGTSMSQSIGVFSGKITEDSLFTYSYALDRDSTTLVTVDSVLTYSDVDYSDTTDTTGTTTNITQEQSLTNLVIYPNPASDKLIVSFSLDKKNEVKLKISNIMGEVIINDEYLVLQGNNTNILDISDLIPGFYLLSIYNNNNCNTLRFIKK